MPSAISVMFVSMSCTVRLPGGAAHRGVPPFAPLRGDAGGGGRHRGGFGPGADAELREDAAHVVLGGLRRDEEAAADLGVRQALAEEGEHLALPRRELGE